MFSKKKLLIYDFISFILRFIYLSCLNFRIAFAFINFEFCIMFHDCKIRYWTRHREFLHFIVTVIQLLLGIDARPMSHRDSDILYNSGFI
jgi:hypothetical protein